MLLSSMVESQGDEPAKQEIQLTTLVSLSLHRTFCSLSNRNM